MSESAPLRILRFQLFIDPATADLGIRQPIMEEEFAEEVLRRLPEKDVDEPLTRLFWAVLRCRDEARFPPKVQ